MAGISTRGNAGIGHQDAAVTLFSGQLTVREVADLGLQVSGDASVLYRVLPEPAATSLQMPRRNRSLAGDDLATPNR